MDGFVRFAFRKNAFFGWEWGGFWVGFWSPRPLLVWKWSGFEPAPVVLVPKPAQKVLILPVQREGRNKSKIMIKIKSGNARAEESLNPRKGSGRCGRRCDRSRMSCNSHVFSMRRSKKFSLARFVHKCVPVNGCANRAARRLATSSFLKLQPSRRQLIVLFAYWWYFNARWDACQQFRM